MNRKLIFCVMLLTFSVVGCSSKKTSKKTEKNNNTNITMTQPTEVPQSSNDVVDDISDYDLDTPDPENVIEDTYGTLYNEYLLKLDEPQEGKGTVRKEDKDFMIGDTTAFQTIKNAYEYGETSNQKYKVTSIATEQGNMAGYSVKFLN